MAIFISHTTGETRRLATRCQRIDKARRTGRTVGNPRRSMPGETRRSVWRDSSLVCQNPILVAIDALPPQKSHGRIILVNEHTASAGEMVAAFAEENNLATIVGIKTPGRLLSAARSRPGLDTSWAFQVAAYLTWQGKLIEGRGVTQSIPVAQPPEQLLAGEDPQMQRALELARGL